MSDALDRKPALVAVVLRPETLGDVATIGALTTSAFLGKAFSDGTEGALIDALRRAGALSLSLVAEGGGSILGHVALSPATVSTGSGTWFALGPISVAPPAQRQGLGGMMIRACQSWIKDQGASGCILIGDTGYYPRFGFQPRPDLAPQKEPAADFMIWKVDPAVPDAVVGFHPILQSQGADQ